MPLGAILAAVMRSAAQVQGEGQAKETAAQQIAAGKKVSVTMTANPNGGPPIVNVKNAPADLLNGTQESDVQKSYVTPRANVEKTINAAGGVAPVAPPANDGTQQPQIGRPSLVPQPQSAGQFETAALRDVGYVPHETDRTAADLQTYGQDFRAQRDLGETIPKAAVKAIGTKLGIFNRNRMAEDLNRVAATQNAAAFRNVAEPVIQEQDRQARLDRSEFAARNMAAHQAQLEADTQRRLLDAERKQVLTQKQDIINKTDWSLVEPDKIGEVLESQNTSGVPFSEFEIARAKIKARQDVNKAFADFTGNAEKYALGTYESWDEAKKAFGHPLTPQQESQGQAAWKAAHTFAIRKSRDDQAMQALREARLERIQAQLAAASVDKPVPIGRADLDLMDADELLQTDPSRVKNYDSVLEQKAGLLRKEISAANDKRKKAHAAIEDIQKVAARYGDDAATAGHRADIAIATRDVDELTRQLNAVRQAREARRSGATRDSTKVTTFKTTGTVKLSNGTSVRAGTNDGKTFYDLKTGAQIK